MINKELKIPRHVGIIVDGNGRWAQERGLSRSRGHDAGYKNLKRLGKYILSSGVEILSVYLFSTENFKRDKEEVDHLMKLFLRLFKKEEKFFIDNNIRVVVSGRNDNLDEEVIKARDHMIEITKNNTGGILNICFNYGGRAEIVDAVKKIVDNNISINNIDEDLIGKYLYNPLVRDIDLLIRTSGELRLSNFMLWQVSYAELYFSRVNFPDFSEGDFDMAIEEYTNRDRRFGGIKK